jgi:hypothetical protein
MDDNTLLGIFMTIIGLSDLGFSYFRGTRLPPVVRSILPIVGLGFFVGGLLILTGQIKAI